MNRKSVLFITPAVQLETVNGGGLVTIERLSALARHHSVTVLTMNVDKGARRHFTGVSWHEAGTLRPRKAGTLIQSYIKNLPLSVWRNTTIDGMHSVDSLNDNQWDLVYVDHWLMIELALQVSSGSRILNLHNAEPEVFFRAAKAAPAIKRHVMLCEGQRSAAYLRNNISKFDALHLLSQDDAEALNARGISHPRTRVFLPAVPQPSIESPPFEARESEVLFVGTLSWHANEEGLIWYADRVLPHIDTKLRHQIIGNGAGGKLVKALAGHTGVTAHGYVDDLEPFYQSARCLVAPLRSGSGIKIKILNALARGLPVVTTPVGIEGFPPGYQAAVFVADTPEDFARKVVRLNQDSQIWQESSEDARRYFSTHFLGGPWKEWAEGLSL